MASTPVQSQANQPNSEAFAKEKAKRGVPGELEDVDNSPVGLYLEQNFKKYVEETYSVKDPGLLSNETVLQMIYALEWYDIPRSAKADLVEFHPYLTGDDYEKLYYIKQQHLVELSISGLLFSLVSNRCLNNYGGSFFRKRYTRMPTAFVFGGLLTYALNLALLKKLLLKDFKEEGLAKYFELDLNADLMKQDLAGLGIEVQAKHFNIEATQKRIDDATKKV